MPEGLRIHDLRHTTASLLVSAGQREGRATTSWPRDGDAHPRPLCPPLHRGPRSCGRSTRPVWTAGHEESEADTRIVELKKQGEQDLLTAGVDGHRKGFCASCRAHRVPPRCEFAQIRYQMAPWTLALGDAAPAFGSNTLFIPPLRVAEGLCRRRTTANRLQSVMDHWYVRAQV